MKGLRKTVLAWLLTAALAACAHTEQVELQNQQTGEVVSCGPYGTPPLRATAGVMLLSQCIQDFEKQGFVRLPPPNAPIAAN